MLQERLQGFSCWRAFLTDRMAEGVSTILKETPNAIQTKDIPLFVKPKVHGDRITIDAGWPFGDALQAQFDRESLDRASLSDVVTRQELLRQIEIDQEFEKLCTEETLSLTTLDLIEGHAALLTEYWILKRMDEEPDRFDETVVKNSQSIFRVESMPALYSKALKVLLHMMKWAGLRFELEDWSASFYSKMKHGEVYELAMFLIDYSLHIPPYPAQRSPVDRNHLWDIHPPLRFVAFCLAAIQGFKQRDKTLFHSDLLYSKGSESLARRANQSRPSSGPLTFLSYEDTNKMWWQLLDVWPLKEEFPEIHAIRRACAKHRLDYPSHWARNSPLTTAMKCNLPLISLTPHGAIPYAYFSDEWMSKFTAVELEAYQQPDPHSTLEQVLEKTAHLPATFMIARILEESVRHQMLHRGASMMLSSGQMSCPLTDEIGSYFGCPVRTFSCKFLTSPDGLPSEKCRLRNIFERYFGINATDEVEQ